MSDERPVLRREAIIPVVPKQWIWSYLLIKGTLIAVAMGTMALIAR